MAAADDIANLKSQVLGQWKQLGVPSIGGGLSIEDRAQGLAERLYANQITDLSKLGYGSKAQDIFQTVSPNYTYTGSGDDVVQNVQYGRYVDAGEGQVFQPLPADLAAKLTTLEDPDYGTLHGYYTPGPDKQNYLTYDGRQIGFLGDIGTGDAWAPTGYLQPGDLASWGAQGEGAVSYTAKQAPNGQVYFVPSWGDTGGWGELTDFISGASSGFQDLLKEGVLKNPAAMAALSAGAGTAIGAEIGAAIAPETSAATQTAIGNAVVRGTLAEAGGGDFLQTAATSLLPTGISEATGISPGQATAAVNLAKAVENDNLLGAVAAGANLTGTGGTQIGDTGVTVADAVKAANIAKAVESGNINPLIKAVTSSALADAPKSSDFEQGYFEPGGAGYVDQGVEASIAPTSSSLGETPTNQEILDAIGYQGEGTQTAADQTVDDGLEVTDSSLGETPTNQEILDAVGYQDTDTTQVADVAQEEPPVTYTPAGGGFGSIFRGLRGWGAGPVAQAATTDQGVEASIAPTSSSLGETLTNQEILDAIGYQGEGTQTAADQTVDDGLEVTDSSLGETLTNQEILDAIGYQGEGTQTAADSGSFGGEIADVVQQLQDAGLSEDAATQAVVDVMGPSLAELTGAPIGDLFAAAELPTSSQIAAADLADAGPTIPEGWQAATTGQGVQDILDYAATHPTTQEAASNYVGEFSGLTYDPYTDSYRMEVAGEGAGGDAGAGEEATVQTQEEAAAGAQDVQDQLKDYEVTAEQGAQQEDLTSKYNALSDAQKQLANDLADTGVDLQTAIDHAAATSAEQLQAGLSGLEDKFRAMYDNANADTKAQFDALTDNQKALAASLASTTEDLQAAISEAAQGTANMVTDLGGQLTDFQTTVDQRVAELQQQGLTQQQAIAQVNEELNQMGVDLGGQITGVQSGLQQQIGNVQSGLEQRIGNVQSGINTRLDTSVANLQKSIADQGAAQQQQTQTLQNQIKQQANSQNFMNLAMLLGMGGGQQQQQQPVQTPVADIKSFEELYGDLFGPELKFSDGGSVDDLLNILRG